MEQLYTYKQTISSPLRYIQNLGLNYQMEGLYVLGAIARQTRLETKKYVLYLTSRRQKQFLSRAVMGRFGGTRK